MALPKSEKMDRAGVRTARDIEQKYNFGKSFAEIQGIATDARTAADEAREAAEKVASDIDHEKIFNLLTNNGAIQGIREVDGQIYINASYINSGILSADRLNLNELFANNINMTGKFTHTVEAFMQPGEPEVVAVRQAMLAGTYNAYYDFNDDGVIDVVDLTVCRKAMLGLYDLSTWSKAVKKPVTMTIDLKNPERAITFSGTNMWGRYIEEYVGVSGTSLKHTATKDYVVESGDNGTWTYKRWANGEVELSCQTVVYDTETVIDLPEGLLSEVTGCFVSLNIEEGVSFIPDVRIGAYANYSQVTVRTSRATTGNGFLVSLLIKGEYWA